MLGKCIVKRYKLFIMHKDAEEMEALCLSAVWDGGLRQMFTDKEKLHRMALVSSLAVFHSMIN